LTGLAGLDGPDEIRALWERRSRRSDQVRVIFRTAGADSPPGGRRNVALREIWRREKNAAPLAMSSIVLESTADSTAMFAADRENFSEARTTENAMLHCGVRRFRRRGNALRFCTVMCRQVAAF